jgi:Flp pilus assembly protein TadD
LRQYGRALDDYTRAIRLDPKDPRSHDGRGWLYATCPDPRYRDGKRAVASATRACELTGWKNAGMIDSLAAAYAEAGDFGAAARWEAKAIGLLADRNGARHKAFASRLRQYEGGKPYREETATR